MCPAPPNRPTAAPRGTPDRRGGSSAPAPESAPLFDPTKSLAELVDSLAERQADQFPRGELRSAQLRRFFGEAKYLYRQLESGTDYKTAIEPQFKMLRSKASYAYRNGQSGGKIPEVFHDFLDRGVQKVTDEESFRKFILHFEAVVGFLYGKGMVSND